MSTRSDFRVNSAAIVSAVAAVVMTGAASYAAIKLPADSVGSRELKNNAVTSLEVKNQSLKARDFAPGELPAGPAGPAGPTGAKGDTGGPCDGLLCAGTDADSGFVTVSVNGLGSDYVGAYRVSCDSTICTVNVGGSDRPSTFFDDWFELALADPASATRDAELEVFNAAADPIGRYVVRGALPIEMAHQSGRFQLTITATSAARVRP